MNETTKNSVISAVTSILMLLASIPALAAFAPALNSLKDQFPAILSAIGAVVTAVIFIYKLLPKSKASIIKGAAEQPGVHAVVADPSISQAGPLKDNPKVVAPPVVVPR